MRQSTKWARGSARKETFTVGPQHDPYSRDIVTVILDNRKYEIVACGLAGEYMVLPGGEEIHLAETGAWSSAEVRQRARANYEAEVIRHTGFDSRFWMDKLWDRLDRARWRHDPKAYELQMEIKAAENRAYGGYM